MTLNPNKTKLLSVNISKSMLFNSLQYQVQRQAKILQIQINQQIKKCERVKKNQN